MYVAVWRFRVDDAQRRAFEAAYGPDGAWARLFARQAGYLGTELLGGEDGQYLTIDRWRDEGCWAEFQDRHGEAYRALDTELEALTGAEERIGAFIAPG
jgi:hypothetical protein